ncbi:DDB1- and CUL4-associated factor 13 [Nematocida minor]|uniref:DDB1- and CUL4-associated factor 13 n=1 Tax=Nematocida minor TaxID=1912983 RepID=UPI0022201FD0|nr:DDB1- and CUL4-associated factor 13 [Nematocida minor]KAI5188981.1 DDB1- and CUL4-associated factor 13 [Nematocida minor]
MGILRINTLDRGSGKHVQTRMFSENELTQNEKHKEYMRAVKEVKLDHLFRKPFVGCLDGHTEGVTRIVKCSTESPLYASTSYDGTIKVWNMNKRAEVETIALEQTTPAAISFLDSTLLYSKKNSIFHRDANYEEITSGVMAESTAPKETEFTACSGVMDIVSNGSSRFYASTVDGIEIFDKERIKSIASYKGERQAKRIYISSDAKWILYTVEGNKIVGYDSRTGKSELEIVSKSEINAMSIDPSAPSMVAAGTNSGEIYIYNTYYTGDNSSYITPPCRTLRGHASPVSDIQHSANGTRIVTGSVDRSVRIFSNDTSHRQEALYHNKRMQAINAICCTSDNAYILSGSTDTNIRIWKLDPNSSTKICTKSEENSRALGNIIKEKYKNVAQIEAMKRHQIVPHRIKKSMKNRYDHIKAEQRKEAKRKEHEKTSSPNSV